MEETEPLGEISQNRELIINNIEDISSGVLQIEVEGNYAEFVADTTTTTVPPIPENPHLENSLIWWVNDTDICFQIEVDAWPGTIKWDVYINDVLQFRNSGPAGQSTHFTHLKTSAGSSGDSLTLRVVVYDGDDLLYENTTFATTTLGPGSSYYKNITDVGNECPIGKKP